MKFFLMFLFYAFIISTSAMGQSDPPVKQDQVLDFSAGVIEGEINRPSILLELSSSFKDFNDLVLLREDFNNFHEIESATRLRYFEEKK